MTLADLPPEQRRALLDEARAEVEASQAPPPAEPGTFMIARNAVEDAPPPPPPPPQVDESRDDRLARLAEEENQKAEEDYTAFWSAQKPGKTLRNVHGIDLVLPRSMPLRFEMEAERLKDREDTAAVIYLFDMIFGSGTWAELVKRGVDGEQLPVLLVWGQVNLMPGESADLAGAKRIFDRMQVERAAGKVPDLISLIGTERSDRAGD